MNNIYKFLQDNKDTQLIIVNDDKQAQIASDLVSYQGKTPFVLSDFRAAFGDDLLSFSEEIQDITKVLSAYYDYKKQNKILIAPIRTISYPLPSDNVLINSLFVLLIL